MNQGTIERWAEYIIPAVFSAENKLLEEHPEWKERLRDINKEDSTRLAAEYYRAIAEIIVEV